MRHSTVQEFTRNEVQAALDSVRADIEPSRFYARRVDHSTDKAIAFDVDLTSDLLVFVTALGSLLTADQRVEFAEAARSIRNGAYGPETVTWPGWVLMEATADQWDDALAEDEDRADMPALAVAS